VIIELETRIKQFDTPFLALPSLHPIEHFAAIIIIH
jgi:hypothetical protein